MRQRPRKAIITPHQEHVVLAGADLLHHLLELRARLFRARNALITKLADVFPPPKLAVFPKIGDLVLTVLIGRRHPEVEDGLLHRSQANSSKARRRMNTERRTVWLKR